MSSSVNSASDETSPHAFKHASGDATTTDDGVEVTGLHGHLESNSDETCPSGPHAEAAGTRAGLETLPLELLMHICSFLDARYIQNCLSLVSQPFADILSVDSFWKARITNRWPHVYPAVPADHFDWKKACIEREELHRMWSKPEDHYDHFSFTSGIFAPVDSVHILQDKRVLVSGSRDRYLNIVDVDKLEVDNSASMRTANLHSAVAHKGWIWSLTSLDNQLCSGSWDTYIKLWDLESGCSQISQFKCKSAVLNLHMEPGQIIAGGYDKRLYQLDPRDGKITERRSHRQAVLCLAVNDDFILTGSEDRTICVFDRKASRVLKTIPFESYPMCMSYGDNQLWVGDKQGLVHLYDTRHGQFQLIKTYDVGHTGKVTTIQHTLGAIFTCSTDKTIKVLHPNQDPAAIATLYEDGELAGVHFRNGVLACAGNGTSVEIWRPKVTDPDQSHDQTAPNRIPAANEAESDRNEQNIPQGTFENDALHPSQD